jgi:hypothetical protein
MGLDAVTWLKAYCEVGYVPGISGKDRLKLGVSREKALQSGKKRPPSLTFSMPLHHNLG